MGDGVERALARAAELETLVANEVSALEHAYNDNEVRIRGLLQDLGQPARHPGRPGRAGARRHQQRPSRSHATTSRRSASCVAEQVNEASQRITHTLAEKGEHITLRARAAPATP